MHRFFFQPQGLKSPYLNITDKDELHHIKNVLRLKANDEVSLIDGRGAQLLCQINQIEKDRVQLKIIEEKHYKKEDFLPRITVACAVPKKSKIDFIVEKLTEIGIDKIILLKTERTEVNLKDLSHKIERLEKIVRESLKQSGNLLLPEIMFMDFKELIKFKKENNFQMALIPNLSGDTQAIKDVLFSFALPAEHNGTGFGELSQREHSTKHIPSFPLDMRSRIEENQARNILLAIGPEGDFSQKELALAKEAGFISVRLTDTVLKVDTAAIVAAGFVKIYY